MGSLVSRRPWFSVMLAAALVFVCLAVPAHAQQASQVSGQQAIDSLLAQFEQSTGSWYYSLQTVARSLFWKLSLISLVVTFVSMLFRGEGRDFAAELVRFLLFTGFNYWILINGPAFSQDIINTFVQLGAEAGGFGKGFAPGTVVDLGLDLFNRVVTQLNWFNLGPAMAAVAMALIMLLLAVMIGCNLLMVILSAWVVAPAGIILLGFGGSRWTSDIAFNYYRCMIGIGMKILTMTLVLGIGMAFVKKAVEQISANPQLQPLAVILVMFVALAYLSDKIPNLAASIVGHHGAQGFGNLGLSAGLGAVSAAAGLAAAAASGGIAAAAGAVQAITEAAKSGSEAVSSASSANGGGASGGGNVSAGGDGSTGPGFAGKAATFTAGAVGGLAKGGYSMARSSLRSAGAKTFPGKLAAAARANRTRNH